MTLTKRIHNTETNEIIDVELSVKEIEDLKLLEKEMLEKKQEAAADKAALLDRLGITAQEAKLLLS